MTVIDTKISALKVVDTSLIQFLCALPYVMDELID